MSDHPPTPPPPYQAISVQPCSKSGYENPAYPPGDSSVYVTHPPIVTQPTSTPIIEPPEEYNEVEMLYVKKGKRLIYDFEKVSCCPGQHTGLDLGVEHQIPKELFQKGISAQEWADWISELRDVQKMAPTICGCMMIFCVPLGVVQSVLCAMFCPISMAHPLKFLPCCYGDWYDGLIRWMAKVNSVLNKNDMHAKLMTYKPFTDAPKSKNFGYRVAGKERDKYEMSFLVIALDKEESLKLQAESWDHGVNDTCTSGIGRVL